MAEEITKTPDDTTAADEEAKPEIAEGESSAITPVSDPGDQNVESIEQSDAPAAAATPAENITESAEDKPAEQTDEAPATENAAEAEDGEKVASLDNQVENEEEAIPGEITPAQDGVEGAETADNEAAVEGTEGQEGEHIELEGQENEGDDLKDEHQQIEEQQSQIPDVGEENDGIESTVPPGDDETPAPGTDSEPIREEEGEATEEDGNKIEGLPQSDTFADGEKPESPQPHVGEILSRGGSIKDEQILDGQPLLTPPEGVTPREGSQIIGEELDEGDILDEEILSPEQDREALVEQYHQAIAEREQLQQQNHQLQHKLAEYFRKKKSDEQRSDTDKNVADQEQRYLKYMSNLEELREEDRQMREIYAAEIQDLQEKCQERQTEVDAHRAKFVEFKNQVALNAINSRSGKPILPKDIDTYQSTENRKDQEVIQARLENIKLKNKLKKKEQQLKSKEELADGLHLIDFEQLKIENQTYNEKIEERNEELLKLRKKITNTVQVLTHLKEKLQFVQAENGLLKANLRDVEGSVAQKRDILTRTKQARDALRIDNHRLRQNCGLLGNEPLLRDFEDRKDEADALRERLDKLKIHHAELTLNTTSVRRKIEQIKAVEQN